MTYNITVVGCDTQEHWSSAFDLCGKGSTNHQLYQKLAGIESKFDDSKATCGLFFGSLIPIRTNSFKNLANDLFFPTANNLHRAKVETYILVGAAIWDIITLALRISTLAFRCIYNAVTKPSKIFNYLERVASKINQEEKIRKIFKENDSCYITFTPLGMEEIAGKRIVDLSGRIYIDLNDKVYTPALPFIAKVYRIREQSETPHNHTEATTITNLLPQIFEKEDNKWKKLEFNVSEDNSVPFPLQSFAKRTYKVSEYNLRERKFEEYEVELQGSNYTINLKY